MGLFRSLGLAGQKPIDPTQILMGTPYNPEMGGMAMGEMAPEDFTQFSPLAQDGMDAAPAQKPKFFGKGGNGTQFLSAFAGSLGDAFAHNNNYANRMQQQLAAQQAEEQHQRHRMDNREDQQWEWKNKPKEPKARETIVVDGVVLDKETLQPVWESPYSHIIPGTEGSFFEQPRMGLGGQRAAPMPQIAPVTATNPQTGEKVQLNPQTGQWEPMGGPSPQGSGGFPGYGF